MNVTKRDYYEILGVDRGVGDSDLKGAYRKMALKYHPDRNPENTDAEEKFKEAAEAYSILSDPQKRAAYDRYGHAGVQGAGAPAGFDPNTFADFSDILEGFFFGDFFGTRSGGGRSSRASRPQRGEDLRFDLEIEFEDAVRGKTVEIQVPRHDPCSRCHATGADPDGGTVTCSICNGRGEVIYQQSFLSIRRTCSQCNGRGKLIRKACTQCKGEGYIRADKKLQLNIPAGIETGNHLRVSGQGQPGVNGGPSGDLYVVVTVKEHPIFERDGINLMCTVPVNVAQAALGTDVDVLTFDGLQTVKIPEGTQSGERVRLRGLGVPNLNGHGRGDLFVQVEVHVPKKLTRDQRKLFESLRETLPAENEPKEKSIIEKVKDYFM